MVENRIAMALKAGRKSGQLADALEPFEDDQLTDADDAKAIADFLHQEIAWIRSNTAPPSRLYSILGLFQQVDSEETFQILCDEGLPHLREIFDDWADRSPDNGKSPEDLVFLVKILALYGQLEDIPRIAQASRHPTLSEEYLWAPVFTVYNNEHPLYDETLDALSDPLPSGFAAVCYLDAANARSRETGAPHPFNSTAGAKLLEDYLTKSDSEFTSYAHSAAAALPFLNEPPRGRLLALALDHHDERVQLEAAWASARLHSRAGIDFLSRASLDPRLSAVAVEYLTELGELNAIPARARDPEFMAIAEMARWLSHPMEYGRPPNEIELFDRRQLFWPPVNEVRDMFLVKYSYHATDELESNAESSPEDETGVGLVGNITFALFGETHTDMPPEDIYALHCCWELNVEEHPLAPAEPSIEIGHQILRESGNPNF